MDEERDGTQNIFTAYSLKARPHYSCSCYILYTLRVNIRILTRRSLASNWSSVDEDLRAQVKARRASRRAQAWWSPARARVMWTHLYALTWKCDSSVIYLLLYGLDDRGIQVRLRAAETWYNEVSNVAPSSFIIFIFYFFLVGWD
jgi:hypothetical protein